MSKKDITHITYKLKGEKTEQIIHLLDTITRMDANNIIIAIKTSNNVRYCRGYVQGTNKYIGG